jgi:hypothetical protein
MKMDNKKYLTKYLEKAKMFSNIAVSFLPSRGIVTHSLLLGIFYTLLIYGFTTPCGSLMAPLPRLGEGQWEVWNHSLFSTHNTNSFEMSEKSKRICESTSIQKEYARTPTKRVSDYHPFNSAQEFRSFYRAVAEQESDLKNETWSFLIHKNLYQEYMAWRKANRTKLILAGIIKGIKVG